MINSKKFHNFKSLFKEAYLLRGMWDYVSAVESGKSEHLMISNRDKNKNKISVYARFSPKRLRIEDSDSTADNESIENMTNKDDNDENKHAADGSEDSGISLPLHQRLAMIKISHNLKTNTEALKVLTAEGG